jgi:hypothetical protein
VSPPPTTELEAQLLAAATKAREAAQEARKTSWVCWQAFMALNGATEILSPVPGDLTPATVLRTGSDVPLVPLPALEELARAALLVSASTRRLDLCIKLAGKVAQAHGDAAVKAGQATIDMAQAMEHEACECTECAAARAVATSALGASLARAREVAQASPSASPSLGGDGASS